MVDNATSRIHPEFIPESTRFIGMLMAIAYFLTIYKFLNTHTQNGLRCNQYP
ncbi:MAG: hypothetical protein F6K42_16900 [Leptolyngbya sp. SIO1D8]|nr:hypothetical protein [Leptolyngbya sp. SIO1D8]